MIIIAIAMECQGHLQTRDEFFFHPFVDEIRLLSVLLSHRDVRTCHAETSFLQEGLELLHRILR